MQHLIAEMKHRYPDRYIIIDTPPYLPLQKHVPSAIWSMV